MNHHRIAGLFVLGVVASLFSEPRLVTGQDLGTTSAFHNHRFEYWGTSLAWWGNEVGGQSNAQGREDLVDLFFDPNNGLGMNFVRYNIGAGSNPDTSVQNITRPGAKMEGWVPDAPTNVEDTDTWVWDFDADANQRLILDMAIEHGVSNVEAFANSAPWWMTRNLQSNGTSGGGSNLRSALGDEFAHYMLEVVDHFENTEGIHFETLAPMNEPGSGFWNGNSNQEGMGVPAGFFQDRLIKSFGAAIEDRGVDIKLVGLEETSTDQSADSWTNGGLTDEAKDYIKQVNTHTYGFNGGSLQGDSERLFDAVSEDDLKIYATEYGTGQGAVRLGTQINRDISYLDAAGWTYWQAIEDNNGSGWGLAISNFNGNNPRFDVQDQYFGFKQFSAHIRPGSEIIELAGQEENITAAYDPRTGSTAVVVTNDGANGSSQQYDFNLLDRQAQETRLIRTTDENNSSLTNAYQSLGSATVNGTNVSFDSVGNSITTLVIHHRPNLVVNPTLNLTGGNGLTSIEGWQAEGAAAFDSSNDLSGDGSGSAALLTTGTFPSGRIFQTGIGDADTDLTGIAYQLSLDVLFQNAGNDVYDADTWLGLEFYGADDQTLASVSLDQYETEIKPAFAVKPDGANGSVLGSDPNDSVYRTYVSGRFVAPEGTRYVRPVIRFDGADEDSNSFVHLDNIRLQEIHPEAAAREWNVEGGGEWSDDDNWLNHSIVENNQHAYFGNAIDGSSVVSVIGTQSVDGITFFSDVPYNLSGSGNLEIGDASSVESGLVDVRLGSHRITVGTELTDSLNLQSLPGTSLSFESGFDLAGHDLKKLGSGLVGFNSGFVMNGGTLSAYASTTGNIFLGSDAILDGDFELLAAPGQTLQLGDNFELALYLSLGDTFNNLILPTLSDDLVWDVNYGANLLTAAVAAASSLLGDFDGDGDVDGDDVDFFIGNLDQPATGELAQLDLDDDGQVTLDDHNFHVSTLVTTSNGVTGALLGDVNLDGSVNVLNDGFALVGNLNQSAISRAEGDLNADGIVNVLGDGFLLVSDLGSSNASSTALTASVPEPCCLTMLFAGTLLLSGRRFRRVD